MSLGYQQTSLDDGANLNALQGSQTIDIGAVQPGGGINPPPGMYHCKIAIECQTAGDSTQLSVQLLVADLSGTTRTALNYFVSVDDALAEGDVRDAVVMYGGSNQTFQLVITDVSGTPGNESRYACCFHID